MPIYQEQTNILLVDDNAHNLTTLEAILKDLQQNLIRAYSGEQALKHALKQEFAVILMDAHMPGMDGFEVARLLRSRDRTRYTPIIFLTALYKDELNMQQGYALGAVDYIFKPVAEEILRSKVKVFVDLFSKSTYALAMQEELKKRRQLEQGYKQLAQQTQTILAAAAEGICGVNTKGRITFANPAALAILNTPLTELTNSTLHAMIGLNKNEWQQHPICQVLQGANKRYSAEAVFYQKDGQPVPVEYTASVIEDKRSRYQGSVVVFRDITERKQAEEAARKHQQQLELAQAARLNTMKEMASALAHEVNQPIANIANYLKGCLNRIQQNNTNQAELIEIMQRAVRQSEHAGAIVHRIKDLACKGKLYYEKINLNAVIKEIIELMDQEIQVADTHIQLELTTQVFKVEADKIQLQQVLINLIRNSLDAMLAANTPQRQIFIQTKFLNKKLVEINVIDNGPGFTPEIAAKLFDAYFTTKATGMGMGLSISRTIIEAHGGCLTAQPAPQGGAWFQFVLPFMNFVIKQKQV